MGANEFELNNHFIRGPCVKLKYKNIIDKIGFGTLGLNFGFSLKTIYGSEYR